MPARIARSSVSTAQPRTARKKNQKRSLDAYAIAEKSDPSRLKIRQHRLGEAEDDNPRRKRQRLEDEDEEDDDEPHSSNARRLQQKKVAKGRFDELDVSEGSDSEGNTWHMGHVDDDDDSDLDSDEAFGESDEERFEGFTFRGSSGGKGKKKKSQAKAKTQDQDGDIDLEEDEEEEEEDDDESLGSDAVDLATMLDDVSESEEEGNSKPRKKDAHDEEDLSGEEGSDESEEDDGSEASGFQMSDDEDANEDAGKISQLQDFISTISQDQDSKKRKDRPTDVHESAAPSEYGVGASQKLDIADLLAGTGDPNAKKVIKMLKDTKPSKRKGIPGKLDAPLPKRQQDKLDRAAANEKAKETLDRWVDTVKQNRRAEHLSFPLKDPDAGPALGEKRLARINTAVAPNDLEKTIHSIMEQSGLSTGKEEDKIREYEELQTNKMPVEEVLARRAELRKARDLLFREEVRAKRIKKIKSKSYRRVHRKERERIEQGERDAMAEAGIEMSEDEKERQDRRRAEERMGAKHRESKWAKGVKKSGRAAWDDDAREGVTEMARRNEELRQRIEGKDVRNSDDDGTDVSSEESEDDDSDAEGGDNRRLRRNLDRLDGDEQEKSGAAGKLAGLKFMQRAEASRKAQNDEDVGRMRRELSGNNSGSEEDDNGASLGRRVFGPTSSKSAQLTKKKPVNEFEERPASDDESEGEADEIKINVGDGELPQKAQKTQKQKSTSNGGQKRPLATRQPSEEAEDNAWLAPTKERGSKSKSQAAYVPAPAPPATESKTVSKTKPQTKKSGETAAPTDTSGWTTVSSGSGGAAEAANEDSDHEAANPFILRKTDLVEKAFAGDEVADAFEEEKRAVEKDEGDKVIDNTLPGWGSWTGEGVSKREQKRNAGRFLTKQEGVKKDNRKDAKLKNVVINEKKVKKNSKFLASGLPFPYENRQVYESTLRRPLGPEFNTKEVFQDGTKPRVMVKPGTVIKPMSKPLV